ncbi:hypothetical protein BH09MYX1_BH09MYX1_50160 [soil metagenome]
MRLVWEGRTFLPRSLETAENEPFATTVDEEGDDDATVFHGDALHTAEHLYAQGVRADLVYVDPPYASQADYSFDVRLDGSADGRTRRGIAYGDRWREKDGGIGAYLEAMAPRLEAMARLLSPTGTLWIHLDWRAAYLIRVLVEEFLGRDSFLNEIVWRRAPNLGRQAASSQFGRTLDTLLVFGGPRAKLDPPMRFEKIEQRSVRHDDQGRPFTTAPRGDYTDASIARLEKEGRVHRTPSGKVYIKYFLEKRGDDHFRERRVDTLWTDISPLRHASKSERTGYPTQKPLSLLERIVRCAAPEGGTVVDLFCGSGTAAEAALRLGRKAYVADRGPVGIATTRARLLRGGFRPKLVRFDSTVHAVRAASTFIVSASAHRDGNATVVELVTPELPLAWAVDTHVEGPFRRVFHGERSADAGPLTIAKSATLSELPTHVRVRVWNDDGAVGEITVKVA